MIALAQELANVGAQQMVAYSVRAETPADVEAAFPPGVVFIKIPSAGGLHLQFIAGLWRALREALTQWKPDVVHLHSSKAGFIGRAALAAMNADAQTRVLYSPHGLPFLDPQRPLRNVLFRGLEALAARTNATLVGCGRSETEMLAALSNRRALSLENPVAGRFFTVERQGQAVPTIVSVGRLSRQKAPDRFALLARALRLHIPNLRCIWVGDGEDHYKAELRSSGCEVTGWVGADDVARFLASAHIYVQTSQWEGLPIAVIQALAAGVPCVVNDCAGNRDAVSHTATGFIARTDTEMVGYVRQLIDDPMLATRMGAQGRREASSRFGSQAFRSRVLQIYEIAESQTSSPPRLREGIA
jgi:glycosyltransferase involved in cell wall biosynthesis